MKYSFLFAAIIAVCMPILADSVLPPPKNGNLYVIAHRGAHNNIPENTLAAYQKAIDIGCDFIEIDLRTTVDGKLVSIHNSTVDAYLKNGKTGRIHKMTLEELKALDIGSRIGAQWKEERIPTFQEILALCKGKIGIYLDLKAADVEQVVPLLREYGMQTNTVWYASMPTLEKVKEICPECLPMPDPGSMKEMDRAATSLKPIVFAPAYNSLSMEYMDFCKAHHALVFADAMTQDTWENALALGVDGIQTDFPENLIKKISEQAKKQ